MSIKIVVTVYLTLSLLAGARIQAELQVGGASCDITPAEPVAVSGQFHLRVAHTIESPITANVLVLESRAGGRTTDLAIMVSCDLLYIPDTVLTLVRKEVHKRLPEPDTLKIFMNGTHIHTQLQCSRRAST